MIQLLRERALAKVLGDGVTGMVGASIVEWGVKRVAAAFDDNGELLDVSKLLPGETYEITTRPAPDRKERKLAKRVDDLDRRAARITAVTRSQRRVERKLAKSTRAATKAASDTKRHARLVGEIAGYEFQLQKLTTPSPRDQRTLDERDRRRAELAEREAAVIAAARRDARPARRQVFR